MQPQLPALFLESKSVRQEEMLEWWRYHADNTLRKGFRYEDVKCGEDVNEVGNSNSNI